MADEGEDKEYRWETGYEKTWEALEEDDEGLLNASVADIIQKAKRRRQHEKILHGSVKLGMMRHVYLVVDFSRCMENQDLKPTRHLCTLKLLEGFIGSFFDQNPISQIGLIITRNKRAEKISDLAGNPRKHKETLQQMKEYQCGGEPSLQNSLEMAAQSLRHMPSHTSKEILIIFGSLTTCDPGDINVTIKTMKNQKIRCSVVGLSAEVRICKLLCKETGGDFGVILDESHYKDLVYDFVNPPPAAANIESSLIKMGFPNHLSNEDQDATPALCMCHLDTTESVNQFNTGGYFCPQCCSKYHELPVECKACGLTLVSAPHLSCSYHHLFPLENFTEVELSTLERDIFCFACQKKVEEKEKLVYRHKKCSQLYCLDCDLFIHESLHTCPGCACSPLTFQQNAQNTALT